MLQEYACRIDLGKYSLQKYRGQKNGLKPSNIPCAKCKIPGRWVQCIAHHPRIVPYRNLSLGTVERESRVDLDDNKLIVIIIIYLVLFSFFMTSESYKGTLFYYYYHGLGFLFPFFYYPGINIIIIFAHIISHFPFFFFLCNLSGHRIKIK